MPVLGKNYITELTDARAYLLCGSQALSFSASVEHCLSVLEDRTRIVCLDTVIQIVLPLVA